MMPLRSLLLPLLLLNSTSMAWLPRPVSSSTRPAFHLYNGIESLSLEGLVDHEEEGTRIAQSLAAWLDAEWMPQEVHRQMGESAKKSYIFCREAGDNDVMSIMMKVAEDLEANWDQYDKDAFVNNWDCANYVSDYLSTKALGEKGCECSADIY